MRKKESIFHSPFVVLSPSPSPFSPPPCSSPAPPFPIISLPSSTSPLRATGEQNRLQKSLNRGPVAISDTALNLGRMTSSQSDNLNAQPSHAPGSSLRFMSSSRFPPPSQPNTSSVSLISSTAQGRPIPLSDTNAANRTNALRELSRSQPVAGPAYTKVSGPPPSTTSTTTGTYSQPILVRTYSGPISSSAQTRSPNCREGVSAIRNRPNAPISSSGDRRRRSRRPLLAISIIRPLVKNSSPREDMKLPSLEAFTFKSIMAEIEQDIGADLDRIAEICARSRYSLSNQYEIHVTPHGSGNSFMQASSALVSTDPLMHDHRGPTLEAISIEDTGLSRGKRAAVRRKSAAYGTLETIMSSSRSSEDDRSKKKSAAEIAVQVRDRIRHSSTGGSGRDNVCNIEVQAASDLHVKQIQKLSKARPSLAAAILDHTRTRRRFASSPPRSLWISGANLVGDPVTPETSHNHLVSRTSSGMLSRGCKNINIGHSVNQQASASMVCLLSLSILPCSLLNVKYIDIATVQLNARCSYRNPGGVK
ncbi:hypothetical protein GGS21DRAFT_495498 [Xylaria nigripes]|nr:hypothetical protein GGS21DRAFT_495498 [Xylaria nigripes]